MSQPLNGGTARLWGHPRQGCSRDIKNTRWHWVGCPKRLLGQNQGTGGPWGAGGDTMGTGTGLTSWQLDGSRWPGKAPSLLRDRDTTRPHRTTATISRWPRRVVVTVLSPRAQPVGTQSHCRSQWWDWWLRDSLLLPHPPLISRSSMSPASPVPPAVLGQCHQQQAVVLPTETLGFGAPL